MESRKLQLPIDKVYKFDDIGTAFAHMEANKHLGKIVVLSSTRESCYWQVLQLAETPMAQQLFAGTPLSVLFDNTNRNIEDAINKLTDAQVLAASHFQPSRG